MATFHNLSPAQAAVFEQIATGNDAAHHPATFRALLKKDLIIEERQLFAGGLGYINRYFVPLWVHGEWCAWCAEQPEE